MVFLNGLSCSLRFVPVGALHFLPGDGRVGAALVADPHCAGVAFTDTTAAWGNASLMSLEDG